MAKRERERGGGRGRMLAWTCTAIPLSRRPKPRETGDEWRCFGEPDTMGDPQVSTHGQLGMGTLIWA